MDFKEYVNNLKRKIKANKKELLFVCIGTTKVLWDSVGPLVGSYLKEQMGEKRVLGDINNNICNKWDLICNYSKIRNKFIIAIDTAISNKELDGQIFVSSAPITMGLALSQNKGTIGDVSIKASLSEIDRITLQYIDNIAKFICKGILDIVYTDQ